MSFTRLKYDNCPSDNMSKSINDYNMKPPTSTNDRCIPDTPMVIVQAPVRSTSARFNYDVSTENELHGRDRRATKCVSKQYSPHCDSCGVMNALKTTFEGICHACGNPLDLINRLSYGKCNFDIDTTRDEASIRGRGEFLRFEPLPTNPQSGGIVFPGRMLQTTRTDIKDNHRPYISKPISQAHTLPQGGNRRNRNRNVLYRYGDETIYSNF